MNLRNAFDSVSRTAYMVEVAELTGKLLILSCSLYEKIKFKCYNSLSDIYTGEVRRSSGKIMLPFVLSVFNNKIKM